jgi:hypothetical protein
LKRQEAGGGVGEVQGASTHLLPVSQRRRQVFFAKSPLALGSFPGKNKTEPLLYDLMVQTCSEKIRKMDRDLPIKIRRSTTAERLTSDRPFLLTSDGQTARHWYTVTSDGQVPVTSIFITSDCLKMLPVTAKFL